MIKMHFGPFITCALVLNTVFAQNNNPDQTQIIKDLFAKPSLLDLVEISTTPLGGLGALEKCGEGSDSGRRRCVNYYECDPLTKTIIPNPEEIVKNTNGFGIIDIRFGEESLCANYLQVCCSIGQGGNGQSSPPPPTSPPLIPTSTTEKQIDNEIPTQHKCGIRNEKGVDFEITGNLNNEAQYGEFPWMVAVLRKNFNAATAAPGETLSICGGSLISPSVILTGAHCVRKFKASDIRIRAGEWDTQTTNERLPFQERDVREIISHPDFNPSALFNDVALLILDSPVKRAQHIATICLPPQNEDPLARNFRECYATGWGKEQFSKESQNQVILKKIQLPLVQHAKCQAALRTTRLGQFFKLDKSFMCAGGEQGKDTCTGDGGGPLVCLDPRRSQYVQVGIVAWGIGCAEQNIPGVYADVGKFRRWVDDQMRNYNIDTKDYVE